MVASPLPRAFRLLDSEKNLAVGPALVEALPDMEPHAQSAAVRLLGQIGHRPSLATVVGRFLSYDEPIQQLLIQHVSDLFSGVGGAILSPTFEERESAVELIARSHSGRLAYLLSDSLRGKCPRTRELAANVLRRMAAEFVDTRGIDETPNRMWARQADDLADALRKAVSGWELHLQPKALEAALWMNDRVEPALREKLAEPRQNTEHAINDLLEGASDPRMAAFALRALALKPLRAAASKAISRAHVPAFMQAVVEESWILLDPAVARACRRVRESPWLHGDSAPILALDDRWADSAVLLLGASGGPLEAKYQRFRELLLPERPALRRAVLWHLVSDPQEPALELLRVIASRNDADGRIARHEVNRRERNAQPISPLPPPTPPTDSLLAETTTHSIPATSPFEQLWNSIDGMDAAHVRTIVDQLREDTTRLLNELTTRLDSNAPSDRVRALRIAQLAGMNKTIEAQLYRLAADVDPLVRGQCIIMLGELATPTALRILRAAVNDPNTRVQANAIELLDHLNVPDRQSLTEPKLESRDARLRANAVKSLLRMEVRRAGDALLEMLSHKDRTQRASALWVISRLQLGSVIDLVVSIARSDPDKHVRHRAQRLLDQMKHERAVHAKAPVTPALVAGGKAGAK